MFEYRVPIGKHYKMKEDFEPLFRTSPFLDHNGPFYQKHIDGKLVVGLEILPKHVNGRGYAHAGILLTLADIAMGYSAAFSEDPPLNLVTISLNNDFMSGAKLGDWLEAHVAISKKGRTLVYANMVLTKGDTKVMRSSVIYSIALPK